jgi:hypothetical protein
MAVRPKDIRMVVWTRFAMPMVDEQEFPCWKDPDWINYRIEVYKRLTLHSLRRQWQVQDFDIALECHPDTKPLLEPHIADLADKHVHVVFDQGRELFKSIGSRYKYAGLLRIDSDDMYAPTAVAASRWALSRKYAMQFVGGWWWHITKGLCRTWVKTSPPFYAVRKPCDEITTHYSFFGDKLKQRGRWRGHTMFRRAFRPTIITHKQFCVCVHDKNILAGKGYGKIKYSLGRVLPIFGISPKVWRARSLGITES